MTEELVKVGGGPFGARASTVENLSSYASNASSSRKLYGLCSHKKKNGSTQQHIN